MFVWFCVDLADCTLIKSYFHAKFTFTVRYELVIDHQGHDFELWLSLHLNEFCLYIQIISNTDTQLSILITFIYKNYAERFRQNSLS